MALTLAPQPGAVSNGDLRNIMIDDLKRANDPSKSPYERFMSLLNASRIAESFRQTGERLPEALSDPRAVRAQLLALGQQGLATAAHSINSGGQSMDPTLNFRTAQTLIALMAEEKLQTEEASYRIFGGKDHFDRRLSSLSAPKALAYGAAGDIGSVLERMTAPQAKADPGVEQPKVEKVAKTFTGPMPTPMG